MRCRRWAGRSRVIVESALRPFLARQAVEYFNAREGALAGMRILESRELLPVPMLKESVFHWQQVWEP